MICAKKARVGTVTPILVLIGQTQFNSSYLGYSVYSVTPFLSGEIQTCRTSYSSYSLQSYSLTNSR